MSDSTEAAAPQPSTSFSPAIPHSVADLGIPSRLVHDLFLKRVYADGTSTLRSLSEALKLSPTVVENIFRHLRHERLLDVRTSTEDDYIFSLTSAGQAQANDRMRVSQYIGPAPVSLRDYIYAVRSQQKRLSINRDTVRDALSDLVIGDEVVDSIGPALTSQKPIFLYGPTGTGKTVTADRLHRIYQDFVFIPYAVEVDGQIIIVHDPVMHQTAEQQPDTVDARWVLCRRPFVVVGGELTSSMLELRLDDSSRTYAAPVQMKANNGMLVIDDFGRQVIPPRKMLNRWVVPMDRRLDFLALRYGLKFEIPFEIVLVFATNLDPTELADAAFLRRLPNKIHIGPIDTGTFDEIFTRYARNKNIECEPGAAADVRKLCLDAGCTELRACLPADLCLAARAVQEFEERTGPLTRSDFARAVNLYFAKTTAFSDTDIAGAMS